MIFVYRLTIFLSPSLSLWFKAEIFFTLSARKYPFICKNTFYTSTIQYTNFLLYLLYINLFTLNIPVHTNSSSREHSWTCKKPFLFYETFRNFISTVTRLDYHDCIGKVRNKFENEYKRYKIFRASIYIYIVFTGIFIQMVRD